MACMPVGHDAWKASVPLSDLDQQLSIAKHDPNVNAKQVVGVCDTSSGLYTLCPTPLIRGARGTTLRGGPDGGSRRQEHFFPPNLQNKGFPLCVRSICRWKAAPRQN